MLVFTAGAISHCYFAGRHGGQDKPCPHKARYQAMKRTCLWRPDETSSLLDQFVRTRIHRGQALPAKSVSRMLVQPGEAERIHLEKATGKIQALFVPPLSEKAEYQSSSHNL